MSLYACESGTVSADVRAYCLDRGADPRYRIALAGYEGEGHESLEKAGWECVAWKAQGGYGNRSKKGKANAKRERLWFSPHCLRRCGLFDVIDSEAP
jgi:DNA adenine methylase